MDHAARVRVADGPRRVACVLQELRQEHPERRLVHAGIILQRRFKLFDRRGRESFRHLIARIDPTHN